VLAALIDAAARAMKFFLPGKTRRAARRLPLDFTESYEMNTLWSKARVKVRHRMAMHLHVERFRLRNTTPMVSFTLDDLPKSAVTAGADILEAHGARGTFYVSAEWLASTRLNGHPAMPPTCFRCIAATTNRLSHLLAPAGHRPG